MRSISPFEAARPNRPHLANSAFVAICVCLVLSLPGTSCAKWPNNSADCPEGIVFPCSCSANAHKLAVECAGGDSLEHVLGALEPLLHEWRGAPVEVLVVQHTPIPVLYLDALHALPPIRRLVLRNNSLSHILHRHAHISLLDSVQELHIDANELDHFAHFAAALSAFRALRSLSLAGNRLSQIPAHTFLRFHSRNRIEELDLSGNALGVDGLSAEALLGLESLRKLAMDRNQLARVPVEAIGELADSLEELYLGANQIERGDQMQEALALPRLRTLSLDANRIDALDGDALRGMPGLLYLYLSNNRFTSIPPQMFAFVRQLKVLAMNGNPVRRLDAQTFALVPNLLRLELSGCAIESLDEGTFTPVPKLQFIQLSENAIQDIPRDLFAAKLPFLVALDLGHNRISHIADLAFAHLAQLHSLDLSANSVDHVAPNTFQGTFGDAEATLNLEDNPLDCRVGRIEWTAALNRSLRLHARCARPQEMAGVALNSAQLAAWLEEAERHARTPKATQAPMPRGTTEVPSTTTATTTPEGAPESSVSSVGSSTTREELGEWETQQTQQQLGEQRSTGQTTKTAPTMGMSTPAVHLEEHTAQGSSPSRDSSTAVLVLVLALSAVGIALSTLFVVRHLVRLFPALEGKCPFSASAARAADKDAEEGAREALEWRQRLKMFGPCVATEEYQSPAQLKQIARKQSLQMDEARLANSVFYTRQDGRNVRRNVYWF